MTTVDLSLPVAPGGGPSPALRAPSPRRRGARGMNSTPQGQDEGSRMATPSFTPPASQPRPPGITKGDLELRPGQGLVDIPEAYVAVGASGREHPTVAREGDRLKALLVRPHRADSRPSAMPQSEAIPSARAMASGAPSGETARHLTPESTRGSVAVARRPGSRAGRYAPHNWPSRVGCRRARTRRP